MHLIFYLHIRRFGMRSSPLLDLRQDLSTHLPQGLFIHRFSAPSLFRMALSYHFPLAWPSSLQKRVGHPSPTITGPVTPGLKSCQPASPLDNSPVGPEAQGTS